ncbi:3-hydroxyacyl-ACP dehydratase [Danxiaibacter flavus]|uniref:3-hydroxyacyl-ACP dehydratase n=1 Tax=Danxiaibacter flavus TaxID=3049108 RepID=A0ABV3ZEV8_9BACT|nr:3-hydroxyacyl-ACP dehydratase [Chitinophagaceae bacterium DXS]
MQDILSLIPQAPPFVMVDRLLQADETTARTSFRIVEENVFVENGFFKEPGLLENIAQTAAAGAGFKAQQENKPVATGFIGAIKNFEVFDLPVINDEIVTEVVIKNQVFNVTIIEGKIWLNENIIASCEMKLFIGGRNN